MFPKLAARQGNRGNQLSGGEQQMLAIGRALIGNPSVIVEELVRAVKQLAQSEGLTLVLVEQNTRIALDVSPRTVVMDRGRIVYDGPSETLRQDAAKLDRLIGLAKL
jgi:branched-chain amino acid transport system ATP-binding protein